MDYKALIIIPVYNEEGHLAQVLKAIPQKCLDMRVDTLVIDDGSTDRSRLIIKQYQTLMVSHKEKMGHGRSARDGFDYALKHNYDFVVKMDGDGQHHPQYVTTILKILRRGGVDHVHSSRYLRKIDAVTQPPLERRLINIMFTNLVRELIHLEITDGFCGFFGLTTDAIRKLDLKTEEYGLPLELLIKSHYAGNRILEIPHPLIYAEDIRHCSKNGSCATERIEKYYQVILNTVNDLGVQVSL